MHRAMNSRYPSDLTHQVAHLDTVIIPARVALAMRMQRWPSACLAAPAPISGLELTHWGCRRPRSRTIGRAAHASRQRLDSSLAIQSP
jgi:hypothetical protein